MCVCVCVWGVGWGGEANVKVCRGYAIVKGEGGKMMLKKVCHLLCRCPLTSVLPADWTITRESSMRPF